jgi:hypothetical protein
MLDSRDYGHFIELGTNTRANAELEAVEYEYLSARGSG